MAVKTVVIAFCFTWLMWGSIILANQFGYLNDGTPLNMVFFIIGALAPAIVSVTLIMKHKIVPAKQLFKTIFEIKQPLSYYLIVVSCMGLYVSIGALLGTFTLFSPLYLLLFPIMIVAGGLEEVCWRFVLQSSLEKKLSFVTASSIVAIIWVIWHLPLFFIEGRLQYNWNFGLYAILLFGLAFIIAAIYRLT